MRYQIVETDGNGNDEAFVGPSLCDRFAARNIAKDLNTYQSNELHRTRRYYKVVEDGYVLKLQSQRTSAALDCDGPSYL